MFFTRLSNRSKQVNSQLLQKAFKLISYVPAMTLGSRCEPRTKVFKMFWQLSKLWGKTTNWEKASTNGFTKSRCCHPFTNKKQFNKNRIHGSYQCLTGDLLFLWQFLKIVGNASENFWAKQKCVQSKVKIGWETQFSKLWRKAQIGEKLVQTDSQSLAVVNLSPTKNSLTKTESMVATSAWQLTYFFFFDSFWKLWERQVKTSGKNKNVVKVR